MSPFPQKRLNVFQKMQQQRSVQCLQTPAAMSDSRCSSIQASVRLRLSSQHHPEILPPGRGQEDRQGRDRDGRVRPRREERKGRQGV